MPMNAYVGHGCGATFAAAIGQTGEKGKAGGNGVLELHVKVGGNFVGIAPSCAELRAPGSTQGFVFHQEYRDEALPDSGAKSTNTNVIGQLRAEVVPHRPELGRDRTRLVNPDAKLAEFEPSLVNIMQV